MADDLGNGDEEIEEAIMEEDSVPKIRNKKFGLSVSCLLAVKLNNRINN